MAARPGSTATRIVLGTAFLADYPDGGGHWNWLLQYLLGLRALGHDVFLLDVLTSTGDQAADRRLIRRFFERLARYDLRSISAVLVHRPDKHREPSLEADAAHGRSTRELGELARSADLLWNVCGSLRGPLRSLFARRALIDTDPGIYQLSALEWDMGIQDHHVLFTVGSKVGDVDCEVPTLSRKWHRFRPFVHLPRWPASPLPSANAPFTSVTTWRWADEVFSWQGKDVNTSKREAYLRYRELPRQTGMRFKLAANIHPLDNTGDREMLTEAGWELVHPERVARTPTLYRRFIERSLGEFACCKPVYSLLKTGWFSDRSVCYLAAGRPVLCEETGFSDHLPTGRGLLSFASQAEAHHAVAAVRAEPELHSRAARELAEHYFDARTCLSEMLARC
jgi:hypothetical protein